MIARIDELRERALAEISAAPTADALEELRVRYLGRKAELPLMLRGVAELPAAERAEVGRSANRARQALQELIDNRLGLLGAEELEAAPRHRPRRCNAAGRARAADRAPAPADADPPRARRHLPRARLHRHGGAGGGDRPLQLRRAQPQPHAPRAGAHRHLLRRRRACGGGRARRSRPAGAPDAHAHLADAGARHGGVSAAAVRRDPRARLPARLGRHPHPAVPPDRGPRRR